MHLSRITLGRSQAVTMRMSDSYAWHQALWKAFPRRDDEARDFLFRIDDVGRDFQVMLLSASEPELPVWGHWELKRVAPSFLDYQTYAFQLRANPTMRRSKDRRRLAIYQEQRLVDWLQRKAGNHGFEVSGDSLVVGAPMDESFIRGNQRGKHVSVDFHGMLKVTNRSLFQETFQKGIGSAKAFGFGMLMLQPVSSS